MATRQKQEEEKMNPEELDAATKPGLYWVAVETNSTSTGFSDVLAVLIPVYAARDSDEVVGFGWLHDGQIKSHPFVSVNGEQCRITWVGNKVPNLID